MFTGLVDDIGTIDRVSETSAGREFVIRSRYADLVDGESVAVNGACLTVRDCGDGRFTVAAVVTTLGRTTIGGWSVGKRVNLERAMRASDRLGGHIVQGHVDGTGSVVRRTPSEHWELVEISLPGELERYLVAKGSITVDGISLTLVEVGAESFTVSLIPETLARTTLGFKQPGDVVNLEVDVIAKYVEKMVRQ